MPLVDLGLGYNYRKRDIRGSFGTGAAFHRTWQLLIYAYMNIERDKALLSLGGVYNSDTLVSTLYVLVACGVLARPG
jgi:hypothetical protein